jgi:hypothetical protein
MFGAVHLTPQVEAGAGAFLSSFRYSTVGSSCLNGLQYPFDQYSRNAPFASLPDTCPGSQEFLDNRIVVENYARPEYYAKANAAGIQGYGMIENPWDTLQGYSFGGRNYLLGVEQTSNQYYNYANLSPLEQEAYYGQNVINAPNLVGENRPKSSF